MESVLANLETYSSRFKYVKLHREDGVLEVRLHSGDGPAVWTAGHDGIHAELGEVFYEIAHDPETHVVILTGTGDEFLTKVDFGDNPTMDTQTWFRIFKEGKDLINNLLDIEVPIVAAVNGPAWVHAELVTLSDIVVASEQATFADKAHAPGGVVPGDGVHVWWQMLLGPNRARHFLLTGTEIDAHEALRLGFVAEVTAHDATLARAWEIARELRRKPPLMLRYSRVAMVQHIKRRMLDDLGYGLMLEGMGILSMLGK
jgi:enoyl-CoA hydratase/carnithine racemase